MKKVESNPQAKDDLMVVPTTIADVEAEHAVWVARNFPSAERHQPLLGMTEELGELAHAHLKGEQGIRMSIEEVNRKKRDAMGDIMIYAMHYCRLHNWSLQDIILETWSEVKRRDWVKNKGTGAVCALCNQPIESEEEKHSIAGQPGVFHKKCSETVLSDPFKDVVR